ncbi:hypothetical protein [Streptococcus sanguinis]|uniref:Uncharacterized protein n=1 Tax=Streptococcus sanguinis SK353 TaxID=888815 RepID=F0FER1_STRSA|nr:hypothetical protein HMPREF9388_1147 [Streptococcus sanguinis SK353]
MFWRKKWLDELSDSDESPLLECRHLLFEEEAGYPICPSCGQLIKENFPKKGADKARLHLIREKMQRVWSVRFGREFSAALFVIPAIFLPEFLSRWILTTGDYGFSSFFIASRHTPTMISFTYEGYIPLFIFFMGKERFKRFSTFSLGFERFHKILYSWPVRLFLACSACYFYRCYLLY